MSNKWNSGQLTGKEIEMKRMMVFVTMMLLMFAHSAQAAEGPNGYPGGVVYAKDGKAIYHDFKTGQTADLQVISGSPIRIAAISENGKVLVWTSGDRFYTRLMPTGETSVFPYYDNFNQYVKDAKRAIDTHLALVPWQQKAIENQLDQSEVDMDRSIQVSSERARNLSISNEHSNAFLSFESEEKTSKWVFVPGQTKILRNVTEHAVDKITVKPRLVVPTYRYVNTSFYTVNVLPSAPTDKKNGLTLFYSCYTFAIMAKPVCDTFRAIMPGGDVERFEGSKKKPSGREESRNAVFPVWAKAEAKMAVIYHDSKGWGPIEVYQCGPDIGISDHPNYANRVITTGYKKIQDMPFRLRECDGLAWRHDGTLTCLFNNNIYVVNGSAIAHGIVATKFCWVSNDALVFRHPTGALYGWKSGKTEKLLDSVPEEFSYCAVNPLNLSDTTVAKKAQ